jgi:hypothetical protein
MVEAMGTLVDALAIIDVSMLPIEEPSVAVSWTVEGLVTVTRAPASPFEALISVVECLGRAPFGRWSPDIVNRGIDIAA